MDLTTRSNNLNYNGDRFTKFAFLQILRPFKNMKTLSHFQHHDIWWIVSCQKCNNKGHFENSFVLTNKKFTCFRWKLYFVFWLFYTSYISFLHISDQDKQKWNVDFFFLLTDQTGHGTKKNTTYIRTWLFKTSWSVLS